MEVHVEFQSDILRAVLGTLAAPGFNEVAALALNETVRQAQGETVQILRPMIELPSKDIEAALHVEPARPEHLEAALVARDKAIPMIRFHPRASRTEGVILQIAGKQERYSRAFIATVKHGHVGVFERKGQARLPIRELYGPSVHGMMARTDVLPKVADYMNERLLANLARQIDRRARRDAGHYGGH